MKEFKLNATRQKDYYGKAKVIDNENGVFSLRSYDTIVCEYDTTAGEFRRLWGGYSRTTANHVNDFRRLFGLPAVSKKEWESLPCSNMERYKVEFSNGFVNWVSEVVFDDEEDAYGFAESVEARNNYRFCAAVIPV